MKYWDIKNIPLGTASFTALREDKQIYVDKTKLIHGLAYKMLRDKINYPWNDKICDPRHEKCKSQNPGFSSFPEVGGGSQNFSFMRYFLL